MEATRIVPVREAFGPRGKPMFRKLIGIAATNAIYFAGTLIVLVSVLAIWSSSDLTLRKLGSPVSVLCFMSLCIGVPVFWAAAASARRILNMRMGLAFHFMSVGVLYAYIFAVVWAVLAFPPPNGLEGGDITLRLSALVAALGVMANALSVRRGRGEAPPRRSTRAGAKGRSPG